jgi:hypothetical protein
MTIVQINRRQQSEFIDTEAVGEHLAKLIISHSFDPYSNQIVNQAITLLECLDELLSQRAARKGINDEQ